MTVEKSPGERVMPLMRSRILFQPSELHSVVESRNNSQTAYSGGG